MEKTFFVNDIPKFAKTIGDMNPLHHNTILAKKAGFEGIIAPGVIVMGFVSATIAEMIPMAIVRHLEVDFLNPLYDGSIVQVVCTILKQKKSIAKVKVEVYSTVAIAKGFCLLLIPQMRKRQQKKEHEKEKVVVV